LERITKPLHSTPPPQTFVELAALFFLADYLNFDTIDGFLAHGVVLLVFYLPVSGWRGVSESNRLLLSLRSATVREWLAPYNNPA